jgi:4-hydroxy-3-polyprenylbenzoate decarboxylase
MIHTKNKLGINMVTGSHLGMMYSKYEQAGETMPICISQGGDMTIFMVSTLPIPVGANEADFAGGLRKEPLELVRAETNDLLVPANAEIVIEGELRPYERWDEGPFGEYDGFMNRPRRPRPLMRVTCITHRKNPILPAVCEGFRLGDSPSISNCTLGPLIVTALRQAGIMHVTNGLILPETSWAWPVLATKVPDQGYISELMNFVWSVPVMGWVNSLHLVDDDVDINDSGDVLEEFVTRLRPERMYRSKNNKPTHTIVAYMKPEELAQGYDTTITFDNTTHPGEEKPKRIDIEHLFSEDTQKWLMEKWEKLGFEEEPIQKKVEHVFKYVE